MVFSTIGLSQPGKLSGTNTKVSGHFFTSARGCCVLRLASSSAVLCCSPPSVLECPACNICVQRGSTALQPLRCTGPKCLNPLKTAEGRYCSDAASVYRSKMPELVNSALFPGSCPAQQLMSSVSLTWLSSSALDFSIFSAFIFQFFLHLSINPFSSSSSNSFGTYFSILSATCIVHQC
jgi:hypothetical protein